MPKSTSTFIKSKMNKDTDSRILPSGEYRDAQNVSISKSEGADVGALENVLGNRALVNINDSLGANIKNLQVIGNVMDTENDRIFFMLTNYNDTSADFWSNFAPAASNHYIYCYNINTNTTTQLVSGNFLNFSKSHIIYGINLLEDLLFWTDNRNQPRKINVQSAINAPATSSIPYYTTEDQISVAKYYPYNPIRLYRKMGPFTGGAAIGGTITNTGSTTMANTFGEIQVGDKIVVSDPVQSAEHMVVYTLGSATNQGIRVSPNLAYNAGATFTFYRSLMKDVVSEFLPQNINVATKSDNPFYNADWPGDPNYLKDKFVRFSYLFKFDDGEYSLIAPFTQSAFIPEQDGYFMNDWDGVTEDNDITKTYVSTIVDFMENKVNDISFEIDTPTVVADLYKDYKIKEIQLLYKESDSNNIKVLTNILYTDGLIADQEGTYNLILSSVGTGTYCGAPTDPTNNVTGGSGTGMTIALTTDNSAGGDCGTPVSAVVVNKGVGYINGDTIYPTGGNSDAYFTISLVDDKVFSFNYQSRKPITTIPSDQISRVYDKVPIRALAQESTGNRIVYGNYINKHTSPSTLDYEIKVTDKLSDYEPNTNYGTVQYPTHSLKQNRNYQVGIVLADKYGRQSDVILSPVIPEISNGYGGSTVFAGYRSSAENASKNALNWLGDSLKVIFNTPIPSNISTEGYPGLYSITNPLGWYSYKVVVKQQEQEYYNVYLPGILKGYPFKSSERQFTSFSTLYSDNINKIPKDLQDVGPIQTDFRSGERLWGRVENFPWTGTLAGSKYENQNSRQYYPNLLADEAIKVGTMTDLKLGVTSIIRAQNLNAATNNFLLSSFNSNIQIGMSVNSAAITTSIVNTAGAVDIIEPGSGYTAGTYTQAAGDLVLYPTTSTGTGASVTITVDANGSITGITVPSPGPGANYNLGDILVLTSGGGSGGKFIISAPTITDYTEYSHTVTIDAKAKMTISVDSSSVPVNEIFKINERGENLFYSSTTNPYLTKFKNLNPIGVNNAGMEPTLAVYETKPTFSNLDIYWETSTSGLISELNTAISEGDTDTPYRLSAATGVNDPVLISFNENMIDGTYITTAFKGVANPLAPTFLPSTTIMVLDSVFAGTTNVTSQFYLWPKFDEGMYRIKMNNEFACSNIYADRNFLFNIRVYWYPAGSTFQRSKNFQISTTLQNNAPTITPVGLACGDTIPISKPLNDLKVAEFNGVNGSSSTTLKNESLNWVLLNYTGNDFEMRAPTTPYSGTEDRRELWVKPTVSLGTYNLTVRLIDGPGAVDDCAVTVTVT